MTRDSECLCLELPPNQRVLQYRHLPSRNEIVTSAPHHVTSIGRQIRGADVERDYVSESFRLGSCSSPLPAKPAYFTFAIRLEAIMLPASNTRFSGYLVRGPRLTSSERGDPSTEKLPQPSLRNPVPNEKASSCGAHVASRRG